MRSRVRVTAARKRLTVFPKHPMLVIAVTLKVPWYKPEGGSASGKLVNSLAEKLRPECQFLVFAATSNLKSIERKMGVVPGSQIYVRARV